MYLVKKHLIYTFCIICILFSLTACNKEKNTDTPPNTTDAQTEVSSDIPTEYYLENGYYTVGIDIPAGTCNIYATGGSGNILYSADGTIDTYSTYDDDLNQALSASSEIAAKEIENYTLKTGYTIHISGNVRVKAEYHEITAICSGRNYDTDTKITLKSGSYEAGKDFEPGVYTITAIEGNGSLSSSNAFNLGIDELFGVFDGSETYVPKAVNITLSEGTILDIADITVEMVREKQ